MKRGKDEEKIMGPMFPRLHVNDAEKGGPRAPPRNKMALYEQLSIPSQRFIHGGMPTNRINTTSNSVSSASSSQLARKERAALSLQQLPHRDLVEEPYSQHSELSAPTILVARKKKLDEEDFRVPIFNHARTSQDSGYRVNDMDRAKFSSSRPPNSNHSTKFQKNKQISMIGQSLRREREIPKEVSKKEFLVGRDQVDKAISSSSAIDMTRNNTDASICFEPRDGPSNAIERLKDGHIVLPSLCVKLQCTSVHSDGALREHSMAIDKEKSSTPERDFSSGHNTVNDVRKLMDTREDRSFRSLQMVNTDRADSMYMNSAVESVSGHGISPDDIVGVLGLKNFWKARRAIANQQRIFAVQVFELHRLIKVQRLIAGMPHLMVEEASYLGKPVNSSAAKKLPFNSIVQALPSIPENEGKSEKPDHIVECSTENTVGKASLSTVQNGVPASSSRPLSDNTPAPSMSSKPNVGPWCFNPPHGQQWLIPVMSPSEGLVYKPYPGPDFVGPVYGPPGSTPVMGNFSTPAYGVPAPHHHYQLHPFPPTGPHSYFPPYGMPFLNPTFSGSSVEQMNPLGTQGKLSGGEANQSSFNMPSQKSKARPVVPRLHACEEGELQGSTASSPSERLQDSAVDSTVERQNAQPFLSASLPIDVLGSGPQPPEPEHPARAIKVVPHNARSATESAARIFQIIQEERKRQDSA